MDNQIFRLDNQTLKAIVLLIGAAVFLFTGYIPLLPYDYSHLSFKQKLAVAISTLAGLLVTAFCVYLAAWL